MSPKHSCLCFGECFFQNRWCWDPLDTGRGQSHSSGPTLFPYPLFAVWMPSLPFLSFWALWIDGMLSASWLCSLQLLLVFVRICVPHLTAGSTWLYGLWAHQVPPSLWGPVQAKVCTWSHWQMGGASRPWALCWKGSEGTQPVCWTCCQTF